MKLVQRYRNFQEAEEKAALLRSAGVLAHVADEYSNVHSYASGAFEVSLWVVIDDQFDDACNVLNHEDYTVGNPLSEQQMMIMEKVGRESSHRVVMDIAVYLAIFFGGLVSFVWIRYNMFYSH